MDRSSKQFVIAMALAAATFSGSIAGLSRVDKDGTDGSKASAKSGLTVKRGTARARWHLAIKLPYAPTQHRPDAVCGLDWRGGGSGRPIFIYDDGDGSVYGGDRHCDLHSGDYKQVRAGACRGGQRPAADSEAERLFALRHRQGHGLFHHNCSR